MCQLQTNFKGKTELKEHMDSEHTHDCDHCSLKLKTKSLLKIHNNSMHVFECEVCKEKKATQDDLNKHIEGCIHLLVVYAPSSYQKRQILSCTPS